VFGCCCATSACGLSSLVFVLLGIGVPSLVFGNCRRLPDTHLWVCVGCWFCPPPPLPPSPVTLRAQLFRVGTPVTVFGGGVADDVVLTTRQESYLDWLCTAPAEREPSSKRRYADAHGTTTQTLRNWEKNQVFRDEWRRRVDLVQGSPEKTHSLLESLYAKAMDGDMKAADLYLRATNRMSPQPIKVETSRAVAELSDEELAGLVALRAEAELRARADVTVGGLVDEHLELR